MIFRLAALAVIHSLFAPGALAESPMVAKFSTVLGDFDVLLRPDAAPISVANFISYADAGRYDSTIFHRSTTYNSSNIQIVQGGGFALSGETLSPVETNSPIVLEASLPNLRGTIAMARTAVPDSATSQWYFNVTDSPGLDGSYAVFGSIMGSGGFSVLDALGAVTVYDASGALGAAFSEMPLLALPLVVSSLVLVQSVTVAPFSITKIQQTNGGIKIDWSALSTNTPVRVERTTNLVSGNWEAVSTNNRAATFTDTNVPAAAAFYRVVTE